MHEYHNTRRRCLVLLALGSTLAGATRAMGGRSGGGTGLGEERRTAYRGSVMGTVTAIDTAARRLTLRGPRGEVIYRVDPKVKALETIKVGDSVRLDYVAFIGLTLRRGGSEKAVSEAVPAQPAAKPHAAGERIKGLRVLELDAASQIVRLQGPKGDVADFHVRDKADLSGVRVGDRVEVVVYELVAGEVVPTAR
jgi:hypothetical protein